MSVFYSYLQLFCLGQCHLEYRAHTLHIIFCCTVEIVDTILLLLNIGKLSIAETADLITVAYDCLHLRFQSFVEILFGNGCITISQAFSFEGFASAHLIPPNSSMM